MSYVKLMVHAVWATKNRERILVEQPRKKLLQHIRENATGKNIFIDTINGEPEHIHCLFGLNADMALSKAFKSAVVDSILCIPQHQQVKCHNTLERRAFRAFLLSSDPLFY